MIICLPSKLAKGVSPSLRYSRRFLRRWLDASRTSFRGWFAPRRSGHFAPVIVIKLGRAASLPVRVRARAPDAARSGCRESRAINPEPSSLSHPSCVDRPPFSFLFANPILSAADYSRPYGSFLFSLHAARLFRLSNFPPVLEPRSSEYYFALVTRRISRARNRKLFKFHERLSVSLPRSHSIYKRAYRFQATTCRP